MNRYNFLDQQINNYITNNGLDYTKEFVTEQENTRLINLRETDPRAEELKSYEFDYNYEVGLWFYKKTPVIPDNDKVNQFISIQTLNVLKETNDKQNTIKNILIFWVVLTIISVIVGVLITLNG